MEKKVELTVQFSCGCGFSAKKDGNGSVLTFPPQVFGAEKVTSHNTFPAQKMALAHAQGTGHTLTITGLVSSKCP